MFVCMLLALLAGCNKAPANIKPLDQHLAQAPQDWKDAYGDTIETQVVFNTLVSRNNEILIAGMMDKLHPADVNDPNNLKVRIEALETIDARVKELAYIVGLEVGEIQTRLDKLEDTSWKQHLE